MPDPTEDPTQTRKPLTDEQGEPKTTSTCIYSEPVDYMILGRICTLDKCSCFNWHKQELVKTCPTLKRNGVEPEFLQEILEQAPKGNSS
jgi:hypothetical protein